MAKLLYNPIMSRWMGMSDDESTLFKGKYSDYDDPTYLTFRLEFGDWGASVLDRSMLSKGTTLFSAQSLNYDQLPMGLLNCPAPGADDNNDNYWYNSKATFNNTENYSAFAYLRSRNEDVRAQYLYGFVNGLFELQKETPYMFKSVAGLGSLDKVTPADGQRIKKDAAKLTVECYEGIALKVRTLLEMYKKAAWDEVYQRWILPENMREFKMIVYIFERRTFHTGSSFDFDGRSMLKLSNDNDLNLDVPVKVFECFPCEFDISEANWEDTYLAAHSGEAVAGSKLVINIKNVKTYYKNGLLTDKTLGTYNFDKLLIYDLMDGLEKTATSSSLSDDSTSAKLESANMTVNQVKSLFMSKKVLLENEEMHENYHEYIHGYGLAGPFNKDGATVDKLKEVINTLNANSKDILAENAVKNSSVNFDPVTLSTSRDSWQTTSATVSLLSALRNVMTQITSQTNDTNSKIWTKSKATNNGKVKKSYFKVSYTDKTISQKLAALRKGTGFEDLEDELADITPLVFDEREKTEYNAIELEAERDKPTGKFEELEEARAVPENEFKELTQPREIKKSDIDIDIDNVHTPMSFAKPDIDDPRDKVEFTDTEIEPVRHLSESKMSGLNTERTPDTWENTKIKDARKLPDGDFSELEAERQLDDEDLRTSIETTKRAAGTDIGEIAISARELNNTMEQTEIEAVESAVKRLQKFTIESKHTPLEAAMTGLTDSEWVAKDMDKVLFAVRHLPEMEEITMEDIRELPEESFNVLLESVRKTVPTYTIDSEELIQAVQTVKTTPNQAFVDIEDVAQKTEIEAIGMLKANTALQSLKVTDSDDRLQNVLSLTKVFSQNYTELKQEYAKKLMHQKETLRTMTEMLVRSLPQTDMYDDSPIQSTKKSSKIKISIQDLKQISDNLPLIGLEYEDVKKMTAQNIMQLSIDFDKQIKSTQEITGISKSFESTRKKQSAKNIKDITIGSVHKSKKRKLGHIEMESMKKTTKTKIEVF